MLCASTTKRLKAAGLLIPVKVMREPSLTLARSCSPVSGGRRTAVPSLRMSPFVSPVSPRLKAFIVPLSEYTGWAAVPSGGGAPVDGGGGCCALPILTQRVAASSAGRGTDVRFINQTSDNEIAGRRPCGNAAGAMRRADRSVQKANGRRGRTGQPVCEVR